MLSTLKLLSQSIISKFRQLKHFPNAYCHILFTCTTAKLQNFIYAQLRNKPLISLTVIEIVAKMLVSNFSKGHQCYLYF